MDYSVLRLAVFPQVKQFPSLHPLASHARKSYPTSGPTTLAIIFLKCRVTVLRLFPARFRVVRDITQIADDYALVINTELKQN